MGKHLLSKEEHAALLDILKARFKKNNHRHQDIDWQNVATKLEASPEKMGALYEMEKTEGEPDVIGVDAKTGEYLFCDCSAESPKGRRSVCYDQSALESRKEHPPKDSASNMAAKMGIEILTEAQYRDLQQSEKFDLKTSSWIATPDSIRKLGGALFCDRRYDTVFVYHNGAESYYAARGFRGMLKV